MLGDFLLASAHHLLFFALVAMLALQSAILSGPFDARAAARLVGIDRGYGIAAALLLLIGALRVLHGIKGSDFYLNNPWFHAKVGAFLLAALLSVWPTLAYLGWRRQVRDQPGWQPDPAQRARLRSIIRIEFVLIALILVCAAGMARHGGLRF